MASFHPTPSAFMRDSIMSSTQPLFLRMPASEKSPRATMYLWVPLPEGLASAAFQKRALEDVGVVTLPGSAFGAGAEGFFRIALTVATPRLIEAAERLGKVLATV